MKNHRQLKNQLSPSLAKVLKRLHYPIDVILVTVRWYIAYSLSLRNLEEMTLERGISVDHSTIHRWVIKLVPLFEKIFRKHKRPVGISWRMDETYISIKGEWKYLYRAGDKAGKTIDYLLTAKRDKAAALRFFNRAIRQNGAPKRINIDKSGANLAALHDINAQRESAIKIRQIKHLNNIIEQDHRFIKRIIRPMLGFKNFCCAKIILSGIEIMRMIKKGQLRCPGKTTSSPAQQFYSLVA
jgi:transposase-like protein